MAEVLALIGGDIRETMVANTLIKKGYSLKIFGLPKDTLVKPDYAVESLESALKNTEVLILPVRGVDEKGKLFAPLAKGEITVEKNDFALLKSKATVLTGVASKYLKEIGAEFHLDVVPMMERDEIAIPNAIPTAEGALALAIEKTKITIFGARVVVLGLGRVGKAVAKIFCHMGAKVMVCSRNSKEIQEGRAMGYDMRQYHGFPGILPNSDIVINTVPAMVLDEAALGYMKKTALIIDLASLPGGVDFQEAEKKGILAIQALGLPGIYAPVSAGKILASGIMTYLESERKARW